MERGEEGGERERGERGEGTPYILCYTDTISQIYSYSCLTNQSYSRLHGGAATLRIS